MTNLTVFCNCVSKHTAIDSRYARNAQLKVCHALMDCTGNGLLSALAVWRYHHLADHKSQALGLQRLFHGPRSALTLDINYSVPD